MRDQAITNDQARLDEAVAKALGGHPYPEQPNCHIANNFRWLMAAVARLEEMGCWFTRDTSSRYQGQWTVSVMTLERKERCINVEKFGTNQPETEALALCILAAVER